MKSLILPSSWYKKAFIVDTFPDPKSKDLLRYYVYAVSFLLKQKKQNHIEPYTQNIQINVNAWCCGYIPRRIIISHKIKIQEMLQGVICKVSIISRVHKINFL